MVVIEREVNETFEGELEKQAEKFKELKQKLSTLRKEGKNTEIAELICLDFFPNVKMAKATYDKGDLEKVKSILKDLASELKEVEEGSDFRKALTYIDEAYESLRFGNKEHAKNDYRKIMKIYPTLDKDLKKSIYRACEDIKERILR